MLCVSEIVALKLVEADRDYYDGCHAETDTACKYMHFVCKVVVQVSLILRELYILFVVKIKMELKYLPKKKKERRRKRLITISSAVEINGVMVNLLMCFFQ